MTGNPIPFPLELVVQILGTNRKDMYMVNKKLTEIYLRNKYKNIEFPNQFNFIDSNIYEYGSFVNDLDLSLMDLGNLYPQFDFTIFKNLHTLLIEDDMDIFHRLPMILSKLTSIHELICSELDAELVLSSLSSLQHLRILEISYACPALSRINKLPNLVELRIDVSGTYPESSIYSEIQPLLHIKNLTVNDHLPQDVNLFNVVFPNLETLIVEGDMNFNEPYSFNHLHLKELTCAGEFKVPPNLNKLTCVNTDRFVMTIPPAHMTFNSVALSFEYFDESVVNIFHRCINFCKNAKFPALVTFENELVFVNAFAPQFNNYFHYEIDDKMHLFALDFEECFQSEEIMELDFIEEYSDGFLDYGTNWEMREGGTMEDEDDYLQEMLYQLQFEHGNDYDFDDPDLLPYELEEDDFDDFDEEEPPPWE